MRFNLIKYLVLAVLWFPLVVNAAENELKDAAKQIGKMINIAYDGVSRKHSSKQLKLLNTQFQAYKIKLNEIVKQNPTDHLNIVNLNDLNVTTVANSTDALEKLSAVELKIYGLLATKRLAKS